MEYVLNKLELQRLSVSYITSMVSNGEIQEISKGAPPFFALTGERKNINLFEKSVGGYDTKGCRSGS